MEHLRTIETDNGDNHSSRIDYSSVIRARAKLRFRERLANFTESLKYQNKGEQHLYFRAIDSSTDRITKVVDNSGKYREMLMFGSNNYLGLANHPYVIQKVSEVIREFGAGIAGPPLLNGYSKPMVELEKRLSALKGTESTLIFSSGYNANLGLVTGACTRHDLIIADEYSHASFFDGIKLLKGKCITFKHNDVKELETLLAENHPEGDVFIAVEGIYSMDGDVAPLDAISALAKKYDATLLLDDAHGTGVLGEKGEGTLHAFHIDWSDEVILGTFSKSFAVNGGFISGSEELVNYLRFMARPYMFSASLPPVTIAAVLAGFDVMEKEPWRRKRLHENVRYLTEKLERFGLAAEPKGGIIALSVPSFANIRKMANQFNDAGIFLNAIEFPAVPFNKQRFRISVSANHIQADLDRLITVIEEIWYNNFNNTF
ncbi:MAG: pyridoxal phosphate-dependent aminotransferase family protein [Prolixibacteraceae bacterium]|nr:pyridoxal phosphate-dependent aminotransferase family protein [Prolixibacteraceae bacterium]